MAAATEAAEFFGRGPATRWLLVIAADLAALVLVGLTGQRLGLPEGYATVSTSVAAFLSGLLLAIYGASTLARTLIRGRAFSIFGILQTGLAFLIGLGDVWYVTHTTPAVGGCSVAAGAGCYAVSSIMTGTRDHCIYSSFGLLLTAAGTWLLASGAVLILVWALIALALAFIDLAELGSVNAAAFLWLAATVPPHPFIVVIPAAAIVYAVMIRVRDQHWPALFIAATSSRSWACAVAFIPDTSGLECRLDQLENATAKVNRMPRKSRHDRRPCPDLSSDYTLGRSMPNARN